jgi:hypothetical protein
MKYKVFVLYLLLKKSYAFPVYFSDFRIREDQEMDNNMIPEEYRPISMWGYFGYEILFSIPVVGFICLIIFALGAKNVNKKNFARSYFCYTIICFLVFAIVFAIAFFTGAVQTVFGS